MWTKCQGSPRSSTYSVVCSDSQLIDYSKRRPNASLHQQLPSCQPGRVIRHSLLRIFFLFFFLIEGWSPRHPLPGTTKIPVSQKESWFSYKPHGLHKEFRHSEVYPYHLMVVGKLRKLKFPDVRRKPAFQRIAGNSSAQAVLYKSVFMSGSQVLAIFCLTEALVL